MTKTYPSFCMMSADDNNEDIIASIEVMRLQEESACYASNDYLYQQHNEEEDSFSYGPLESRSRSSTAIDDECRIKMTEWCYQVIDFCKFNRETCDIAMSYLDRYMSTDIGQRTTHNNRKTYQLAAMTCLYTAVKLHEPEAIDPRLVSGLSRGIYSEQQITDMERTILQALQWRMNPPTAMSFVHSFFALMPADTNMSQESRKTFYELIKFQTEVAVNEYDLFVKQNASTIAYASLANALEGVSVQDDIKDSILDHMTTVTSIERYSQQIQSTQRKLYDAITKTKLVPSSPVTFPAPATKKSNSNMTATTACSVDSTKKTLHQHRRNVSSPRCVIKSVQ